MHSIFRDVYLVHHLALVTKVAFIISLEFRGLTRLAFRPIP